MSDLKYTAKIKAKGLDNTGVTEAHARAMAARLGSTHLLIIEVEADTKVTDSDGDEQVTLKVISAEPVPADQENVTREFVRAIARQRRVADGQLELGEEETGAEDAVKAAAGALEGTTANLNDWDGNPDAPVTANNEDGTCPSPWCEQPAGHDGEHDPEKDPGQDAAAPDDKVVAFSGKTKK